MNIDSLFIKRKVSFDFFDVDLFSASDDNLQDISNKMGLALSKEEMNIKDLDTSQSNQPQPPINPCF